MVLTYQTHLMTYEGVPQRYDKVLTDHIPTMSSDSYQGFVSTAHVADSFGGTGWRAHDHNSGTFWEPYSSGYNYYNSGAIAIHLPASIGVWKTEIQFSYSEDVLDVMPAGSPAKRRGLPIMVTLVGYPGGTPTIMYQTIVSPKNQNIAINYVFEPFWKSIDYNVSFDVFYTGWNQLSNIWPCRKRWQVRTWDIYQYLA